MCAHANVQQSNQRKEFHILKEDNTIRIIKAHIHWWYLNTQMVLIRKWLGFVALTGTRILARPLARSLDNSNSSNKTATTSAKWNRIEKIRTINVGTNRRRSDAIPIASQFSQNNQKSFSSFAHHPILLLSHRRASAPTLLSWIQVAWWIQYQKRVNG